MAFGSYTIPKEMVQGRLGPRVVRSATLGDYLGMMRYRPYVSGRKMRINSKGQVTIPAPLREKHGLRAGDEVNVVEEESALRIV